MKDDPCMKAENDLSEATSKLARVHEKIEDLRKLEPILSAGQRAKLQKEIKAALRGEKNAQEDLQTAREALEKCRQENPAPPG